MLIALVLALKFPVLLFGFMVLSGSFVVPSFSSDGEEWKRRRMKYGSRTSKSAPAGPIKEKLNNTEFEGNSTDADSESVCGSELKAVSGQKIPIMNRHNNTI